MLARWVAGPDQAHDGRSSGVRSRIVIGITTWVMGTTSLSRGHRAADACFIRMTGGPGRRTLSFVDVARFVRDGYVAVRGAVDAQTAAAGRELI
jgi:hypothetical protein